MSYILSFDQGTTSSRAVIFNRSGSIVAEHQIPHRQIYDNGWVSHDAEEIYRNVIESGKSAIAAAGISAKEIKAIGITNQRETLIAWDSETGVPVCDAVVWQCRRTAEICEKIAADGFDAVIRKKTGLLNDPYFSATKIKWVLDNVPEARELMGKGRLKVGTVDCYLIWKLTGGKRHVTDFTNASRTMLFNIDELKWDRDILEYLRIPEEILPEVIHSTGHFGTTDRNEFMEEIPITGVAGDQQAALFGQTCFNVGDVKNTYGTGCFILKNIGSKPIITDSKLLTTIAWNIEGEQPIYALEGSIFNAGAVIEWLIRELKLVSGVREINEICEATTDTGGVYLVPAFTGLGAPYWDMYARGTICGMNLATNKNHIVRAVVESIAYQSRDVIEYMNNTSGMSMTKLRADGGVSQSEVAMQFQSDILNIPVERPKNIETTVLGAAYLAGLGIGYWKDRDEIRRQHEVEKVFSPRMTTAQSEEKYFLWKRAVEKSHGWAL